MSQLATGPGPWWRRLLRSLLQPRLRRVDIAVAVLVGLLGFAAAVQVRSTKDDGVLASAMLAGNAKGASGRWRRSWSMRRRMAMPQIHAPTSPLPR